MSGSNFSVRVGRLVPISTAVLCVVFVLLAVILYLWLPEAQAKHSAVAFMIALPLLCMPFVVRGYRLDGSTLYVKRLLHETAIDLSGLRRVEVMPGGLKGLRVFGNGGLFSISGWFWSRDLGLYKAYAMDLGPTLYLKWDKGGVMLTPTEPEAMLRRLQPLSSSS